MQRKIFPFLAIMAFVFVICTAATPTMGAATSSTATSCYPALSLTTTSIPSATAGADYSETLTAAGGQPPYTWSLGQSSLPQGFSVSAGGDLSGTASAAGTYLFHIIVSDAMKNSVTGALTLNIESAPIQMPTPTPGPAPTPTGSSSWTPQFMGMNLLSPNRHWPTVPIGAVRDSGATWAAVEPSRGKYNWQPLDEWVTDSQAHGTALEYVFLNTPQWASTIPGQSCNRGSNGCAAPPKDADWQAFVTAVVTRYKGKIDSYEIWNEGDAPGFWSGTPAQLVHLAALAYPIIKSIDPHALVVSPSDAAPGGWPIPFDTWLDQYLTAGGGKYADAITWHGYAAEQSTRFALAPEVSLAAQIVAIQAVMAKHGLQSLPLWNTEGGYGANTELLDRQQQAAFLTRWYLIQFGAGVARAYWYQWDNQQWGTLWTPAGLTPAAIAYAQVYSWLQGATAATPCTGNGSIWTCNWRKGSRNYTAVWTTSGTAAYSASGFTEFVDLTGAKHTITARGQVPISTVPILLKGAQ